MHLAKLMETTVYMNLVIFNFSFPLTFGKWSFFNVLFYFFIFGDISLV
jgi:hypothetical protein